MRQLGLLLLLLVAVSSSEVKLEISNDIREYIDIVKCFLNQENLLNDIVSFVDVIKSGEYDKLLSLAFKLYADGTAAVKECIKKEEITLEGINTIEIGGLVDTKTENEIRQYIIEYMKSKNIPKPKPFIPSTSTPILISEYEACKIGCQKMYVGYQLSICNSLCEVLYKD